MSYLGFILFSLTVNVFANDFQIEGVAERYNSLIPVKEKNLLDDYTQTKKDKPEDVTLPTLIRDPRVIDLKKIRNFQDVINNPLFSTKGGFSSGGGGTGVVCFNSSGMATEIELLDYYEGLRKDMSPVKSLGIEGANVEEKIISAFSKLENEYPRLAVKLKNRALWLHENIDDFLISTKEGKLSPVYDMNIPFVPQFNEAGDECQIVRFAVQLKKPIEGQKKFFFVKDLYEHSLTDDDTRAGIIIHEVIYEEAILSGAVDSDFVRWLTYLIGSRKIDQMSSNEIQGLEYQPGGEFLGSLGVNSNPRRVINYNFTDIKSRQKVYALNIYDINYGLRNYTCFELGICELFQGEFLGRKRGSSDFLPKFNIMMKSNSIVIPLSVGKKVIETRRGENLVLSNDKISNLDKSICTRRGACVGDVVGVTKETRNSYLSYTGVIHGIFGDGNFAIELIDGRFDVLGEDIDFNSLYENNKRIVLYADEADVSY